MIGKSDHLKTDKFIHASFLVSYCYQLFYVEEVISGWVRVKSLVLLVFPKFGVPALSLLPAVIDRSDGVAEGGAGERVLCCLSRTPPLL